MKLPDLPIGYRWRTRQRHKAVFEHVESGKSYGLWFPVAPDGSNALGLEDEIAYGIAKIARELRRDTLFAKTGSMKPYFWLGAEAEAL